MRCPRAHSYAAVDPSKTVLGLFAAVDSEGKVGRKWLGGADRRGRIDCTRYGTRHWRIKADRGSAYVFV